MNVGVRFRAGVVLSALLFGFSAESNAQTYVKSIEYVEITLAAAATSASAGLTKGQVTANCVPFASMRTTGTDDNFDQSLTDVFFTAGPSVTARRELAGGTVDVGVYIVEFDPTYVKVQQNTLTLNNGTTTTTMGIAGVNLTKAALVFYYRGSFTSHKWMDHAIAGHFSAANQLSFQRESAIGTATIHWYVFEALNAEFAVQPATLSISGGSTTGNVGISSVDLTKSFVIASYRTTYDDDNIRSAGTMVYFTSATNLRAERNYGSSFPITEIRAFVVTLTGADVKRGSLTYAGTQALTGIAAVNPPTSIVWNGVGIGPGVMTSGANASFDVETGFQRVKLASATQVQGDRGESTFAGLGRFEVINFGAGATPVELVSFTAEGGDGSALLEWQTGSELSNVGFHLYRATRAEGPYARITERAIPGLGSSPAGARYSYRDDGLENGVTYHYQLEDIDTSGSRERHGPVSAIPEAGKGPGSEPSRVTVGSPRESRFQVSSPRSGELVVELRTAGFEAELLSDGTVALHVPGFSLLEEVGFPLLPVKRSWIPFHGRNLRLTSVERFDEDVFETFVPAGGAPLELEATSRTVRLRRSRHGAARSLDGSYPEPGAKVLDAAFQGDVRKALVEVAPLRWNASLGQLVLSRRVVATFEIIGPRSSRADGRARPPVSTAARAVLAQLETNDAGLTAVGFEELFPGGRGRSLPVSSLRLSRLGRSVPFHVDAESLRPGATLYFLSEGSDANPYGPSAVYELETHARGERMRRRTATPGGAPTPYYWERVTQEENRYYQAALLEAPDPWLWSVLFAPARESFSFQVSSLVQSDAPSRLTVHLQGASDFSADPDHHVRLYLNGAFVSERSWNGKEPARMDVELETGLLREGENALELENVGDTDADYSMVLLDRFEVTYARRLEAVAGRLEGVWSQSGTASIHNAPDAHVVETTDEGVSWLDGVQTTPAGVRFRAEAGARYHIVRPNALGRARVRRPPASRLRETAQAFDAIVIGPSEFLAAASALMALRRAQGLRVRPVPIEEIFSEFGFGEEDPRAIRAFLSYAYLHWKEKPTYVLLLGDASYDFKNHLGTGVTNHVPPLLVRTSYLTTASDPAMAAVNGDDLLPDLAIGRLPAANVDELRVMIAKILAYETSDLPRSRRAVLVTDNPDHAGDFLENARALEAGVLAGRPVTTIHLSELGAPATRERIVRAFDEGHSLSSYIGHGGIHLWADENVFNVDDVSSLARQREQPILLTMNCLNGYFHFPYFDALAEALLKADGRGVVATFSPSGLSVNDSAHVFHQALLAEILGGRHLRIGDAVLAAQSTYAESGAFPELIAIYHLFGDPALVLR